jgi:hypothetical protein
LSQKTYDHKADNIDQPYTTNISDIEDGGDDGCNNGSDNDKEVADSIGKALTLVKQISTNVLYFSTHLIASCFERFASCHKLVPSL